MAKHRCYSIEFMRQVAQEFIAPPRRSRPRGFHASWIRAGFGRYGMGLGMHRAAAEFADVADSVPAQPTAVDWRKTIETLQAISVECRACHSASSNAKHREAAQPHEVAECPTTSPHRASIDFPQRLESKA